MQNLKQKPNTLLPAMTLPRARSFASTRHDDWVASPSVPSCLPCDDLHVTDAFFRGSSDFLSKEINIFVVYATFLFLIWNDKALKLPFASCITRHSFTFLKHLGASVMNDRTVRASILLSHDATSKTKLLDAILAAV